MVQTKIGIEIIGYSSIQERKGIYVCVKVYSNIKKDTHSIGELEIGRNEPLNIVRQRVGLMAGAAAERQCEKFKDQHNCEQIALGAMETFDKVMIDYEQKRTLTDAVGYR